MASPKYSRDQKRRAAPTLVRTALTFLIIWTVLSLIIFIGMRNYPELPGQKIPKPWMLSVFLLFLISAGFWADIFFRIFYHRLRLLSARLLGIESSADSQSTSMFTVDIRSEWQAAEGTPLLKVFALLLFEWLAIILGVLLPIALLITLGAVITGVLSEQITLHEIKTYLQTLFNAT